MIKSAFVVAREVSAIYTVGVIDNEVVSICGGLVHCRGVKADDGVPALVSRSLGAWRRGCCITQLWRGETCGVECERGSTAIC